MFIEKILKCDCDSKNKGIMTTNDGNKTQQCTGCGKHLKHPPVYSYISTVVSKK